MNRFIKSGECEVGMDLSLPEREAGRAEIETLQWMDVRLVCLVKF